MRRFITFLLISLSLSVSSVSAQNAIIVSAPFDFLRQGTVGLITLSGPDVVGASAAAFDRNYPFFPTSQGFACLLSIDMGQKIQDYPLVITLNMKNGDQRTYNGTVKVASGQFIREDPFTLPPEKAYLVRDDIQKAEDARLLAVYSVVTPERFWEGPLTPPANGPYVSPFGGVRTFNNVATRVHTGVDLRAAEGTPVLASGSGRVVLSNRMDIHGNNVIIDHGWGLFSEYAHLSTRYVVPGQFVLQGDLIGLSGTTGRATGPHLHWEVAVNGLWVDPVEFAKIKLPS